MTTDTVGGVWTYAMDLARVLSSMGTQVVLATLGQPMTRLQRREAEAATAELHESSYRLEWMTDSYDDVAESGRWLLAIEDQVRPDIVHVNGYAHGALPFRAPAVVVAHSCVLSWWRSVKGCDAPGEYDRYRRLVRMGLDGAAAVVAPTAAMLKMLEECHGPVRGGQVIFNGLRSRGLRSGTKLPVVFAAGRVWDEAKNMAMLDRAAPLLQWPVQVAGSCRHPDGRDERPSAMTCLGILSPQEMSRQFSEASIYALPARYEPFGLSVLEAGLSGCALVLGDVGTLREVWGDAAVYVDPADHAALADAINALAGDESRLRDLARRARCRAVHFSDHRMAWQYWLLYRRLVQVRRRHAPRHTPRGRLAWVEAV
jgi:glycosyltransferase involved in cell wall biosynthesis